MDETVETAGGDASASGGSVSNVTSGGHFLGFLISIDDWNAESMVVVPPGSRATFDGLSPDGRRVHRSLSPGVWRISTSEDGATIMALTPGRNGPI